MSWKSINLLSQLTFKKDIDNMGEKYLVEYAMRLAIYAALTAIFMMVIALVIKLLWNCDGDEPETEANGGRARESENSSLLLLSKNKVYLSAYGTNEKDLESGCSSSSDDDLYDGKICVICYDDQRNCFFFPCGHCVTCHTCARRIMKEDNKTCPICRSYVNKVRKLLIV